MNRIKVHLERKYSASYDIHIGRGILDRLALILSKNGWGSRYFIVTDAVVSQLHGDRVADVLGRTGLAVERLDLPAGETSKNIQTCVNVAEQLAQRGADRTSALIALGGGVVGDVTGFVASIFMRGIPHVQVPTTLLAQVDSSIGGKTGVDVPSAKNMLGTFCQPRAVFIDIDFLETLPAREFTNGLAEIVKYGMIEDPDLLEDLTSGMEALDRRDKRFLETIISRSCRIKKTIVEIDETERGLRRILNFGHTVGHALEAESSYALSHGESVALGTLMFFFFIAFNLLEATQPSLISRLAPAHARGAALGVYNTLQSLGLFAGGALGGWLVKAGGPQAVLVATSALALLWLLAGWAQVVPAATQPSAARASAP